MYSNILKQTSNILKHLSVLRDESDFDESSLIYGPATPFVPGVTEPDPEIPISDSEMAINSISTFPNTPEGNTRNDTIELCNTSNPNPSQAATSLVTTNGTDKRMITPRSLDTARPIVDPIQYQNAMRHINNMPRLTRYPPPVSTPTGSHSTHAYPMQTGVIRRTQPLSSTINKEYQAKANLVIPRSQIAMPGNPVNTPYRNIAPYHQHFNPDHHFHVSSTESCRVPPGSISGNPVNTPNRNMRPYHPHFNRAHHFRVPSTESSRLPFRMPSVVPHSTRNTKSLITRPNISTSSNIPNYTPFIANYNPNVPRQQIPCNSMIRPVSIPQHSSHARLQHPSALLLSQPDARTTTVRSPAQNGITRAQVESLSTQLYSRIKLTLEEKHEFVKAQEHLISMWKGNPSSIRQYVHTIMKNPKDVKWCSWFDYYHTIATDKDIGNSEFEKDTIRMCFQIAETIKAVITDHIETQRRNPCPPQAGVVAPSIPGAPCNQKSPNVLAQAIPDGHRNHSHQIQFHAREAGSRHHLRIQQVPATPPPPYPASSTANSRGNQGSIPSSTQSNANSSVNKNVSLPMMVPTVSSAEKQLIMHQVSSTPVVVHSIECTTQLSSTTTESIQLRRSFDTQRDEIGSVRLISAPKEASQGEFFNSSNNISCKQSSASPRNDMGSFKATNSNELNQGNITPLDQHDNVETNLQELSSPPAGYSASAYFDKFQKNRQIGDGQNTNIASSDLISTSKTNKQNAEIDSSNTVANRLPSPCKEKESFSGNTTMPTLQGEPEKIATLPQRATTNSSANDNSTSKVSNASKVTSTKNGFMDKTDNTHPVSYGIVDARYAISHSNPHTSTIELNTNVTFLRKKHHQPPPNFEPHKFSPKCIKFANDTESESTAHHSSAEVDMAVPNEMKVPKTNTATKTIADKRETENARNQDTDRSVDLSSSEYVCQPLEKQMESDSHEITNANDQKSLCTANVSNLALQATSKPKLPTIELGKEMEKILAEYENTSLKNFSPTRKRRNTTDRDSRKKRVCLAKPQDDSATNNGTSFSNVLNGK